MSTIDTMNTNAETNLLQSGANVNIHASYFVITQDGVLSMKPEYRGKPTREDAPATAISDQKLGNPGSKHDELPEHLVIPEVVSEVAVTSLADGLLYGNQVTKYVTFPKTLTEISADCFRESIVEEVLQVAHVTIVGASAFRNSNIKSIWLPELTAMGASAFCNCSCLTHIHIGKVSHIGYDTFYKCRYLSRIESNGLVTSIGNTAFMNTNRLVNANIPLGKLKFIGDGAFIATSWDADWSKLPKDCVLGTNAIYTQYNPVDFWNDYKVTPCENPLPTLLTQWDERWIDKALKIDNKDYDSAGKPYTWGRGCLLFSIMHAYCGLNNLSLNHVDEFIDIVEGIKSQHIYTYGNDQNDIEPFCEPLGLEVTNYAEFNYSTLKALYDALNRGAYGMLVTGDGTADYGWMVGHAITAYGVTESGKLLIADSDYRYCNDRTSGVTYPVPYKTICEPKLSNGITFCVVSKPIEYSRYATIEDALAGTNMVDDGSVGAYSDHDGKYHVVLLADIASADTINIQRDCTLHLNGHTLEFTAAGAYLNIDTANEVVIDGTSIRSEKLDDGTTSLHKGTIKKNETASTTDHQELIRTTGTNLTVYGGQYFMERIRTGDNKKAKAICAIAEDEKPALLTLHDCNIQVTSENQTKAVCVDVNNLAMHNCTLVAETEDKAALAVDVYSNAVIQKCTMEVTATGSGQARGINTYASYPATCTLTNTIITVTATGYNTTSKNHAVGVQVEEDSELCAEYCTITAQRTGEVPSDYTGTLITAAINGDGEVNCNETNQTVPQYNQ